MCSLRWGDYVVYDNQIETIAGFSDGYVMTKSENGTVNKRKKDELFFIQKCNQCGSRVGIFSNRNSAGDLFFFMNCDECDNCLISTDIYTLLWEMLDDLKLSLKPCPICGNSSNVCIGKTKDGIYDNINNYYAYCHNCEIRTFHYTSVKETRDKWNNLKRGVDK